MAAAVISLCMLEQKCYISGTFTICPQNLPPLIRNVFPLEMISPGLLAQQRETFTL